MCIKTIKLAPINQTKLKTHFKTPKSRLFVITSDYDLKWINNETSKKYIIYSFLY